MADTLSLTFGNSPTLVTLPISGTSVVVSINWGDGSPVDALLSHTYSGTGPYTAVVTIVSGVVTTFGGVPSPGWPGVANLTAVTTTNTSTWGLGTSVTSFQYLFTGTILLTSVPSNIPPSVTNLSQLFYHFNTTSIFNQDLSTWDVSHVTQMVQMFEGAIVFNQDISGWDVSNVTDMTQMFERAAEFNQPIGSWNVSNVTTMIAMFYNATNFNQNISNWNVSSVNNMYHMFWNDSASPNAFNQYIRSWPVQSGTNLTEMFLGATAFQTAYYPTTPGYDSDDTTPLFTFFNVPLSLTFSDTPGSVTLPITGTGVAVSIDWGDGTSVDNTSLSHTYSGAGPFTASVTITGGVVDTFGSSAWSGVNKLTAIATTDPSSWGLGGSVTSFAYLFSGATILTSVPTSVPLNVTDMSYMFTDASSFNQDISGWNVSNVQSMLVMFAGATLFNKNLSAWDVSSVQNMSNMFASATAFNNGSLTDDQAHPLNWDTGSVTIMSGMFSGASAFNQAIGGWDVTSVTLMEGMFQNATLFNQNIGGWDVSNVVNMKLMFYAATNFNGDISVWNVSNVVNMNSMFMLANNFSQNIGLWNVGKVNDMGYMFYGLLYFNIDISGWVVSNATDMQRMFYGAQGFNRNITGWDVHRVVDMTQMFTSAIIFNQNIRIWQVGASTILTGMFDSAFAFQTAFYPTTPGYVTDPNTPLYTFFSYVSPPTQYPCFLEGTKILCFENNEELYRPIESLRSGDLVKTIYNRYMPVYMIGTTSLYNPGNDYRVANRLYKCSREKYPSLFEDLYITGCHSILVPWMTDDQWENTKAVNGGIYVTDNHFRLIACADEKAEPFNKEGFMNIYHIALEHHDICMNYGIYANGLLVESCSIDYLIKYSKMKILGENASAVCEDVDNVSNNIMCQLVDTR